MVTYSDDRNLQLREAQRGSGISANRLIWLGLAILIVVAALAFVSMRQPSGNTTMLNSAPAVRQPAAPPSPSGMVPNQTNPQPTKK